MLFSYVIGYICLSQRGIPRLLDSGDNTWLLVGVIVGFRHLGQRSALASARSSGTRSEP